MKDNTEVFEKIFITEINKPNGSYENPYIVYVSWDVYKEIKDKLDKNMMYHSDCWYKVYISADK